MLRFLSKLQPWAITLVRIAIGVTMLYHGWDKVIPKGSLLHGKPLAALDHFAAYVVTLGLPHWLGYVSALTEFLGGILLLAGLLVRFAALMVAGNMIVALVEVNVHHGYSGSEYTIALITMALLLVTTGAGALSLDRYFGIT